MFSPTQIIDLKPRQLNKVRKIQMLKVNSTLSLTADSLRFLLMAQSRHKQNLWCIPDFFLAEHKTSDYIIVIASELCATFMSAQ